MAGTTVVIVSMSVLSNLAIRSLMSVVVVAHIVVAHIVTLVVHHSCALVVHRSILARQASFGRAVVNLCRSRCGLVHVSIV